MDKDPFKEYIRQSEPSKRDKGYAWHTAIGLQAVDGLKPSKYLIDTAIKNIDGDISIDEAQELLNTYYEENPKADTDDRTEEADKVAVRIAKILSEKAFSFTPNEYISIHKKLFAGIHGHAGKLRDNDNKFIELIKSDGISGITGSYINDNIERIFSIKLDLAEQKLPVSICEAKYKWSDLKLNSDGMLPVVVQDYRTNEVLQVAYMNEAAYLKTLELGKMTYWSRSRNELWTKGETSGHFQYVKSLTVDCDYDTMLAKVAQVGAACHTGRYSCFFNTVLEKEYNDTNPLKVFENVYNVISDRKQNPKEGSYTNYLFDKGLDKILKKLGEEATEIVIAAKNPNTNEIKYEISDFLYHMMVLMVEKNISWNEIMTELSNR